MSDGFLFIYLDSLFDQATEPAVVQPTEVPQDQDTELVKILSRILSDDRMKELEEQICKALRDWDMKSKISGRGLDDIVVAVPQTPAHGAVASTSSEVPSSQVNDEEEFSVGPWAAMKAEMGLDERNPSCFLHSYSIVMVLRKAASRQLSMNKVPNMAVMLKSILHTHGDAIAVFRDPTGEMQGTVHRRLLEERQGELKTGAVLLLKQVSVFSPSNRNHYLNVTPNNLLRIYPPDGAVHASSQHSQPALQPAGLLHCVSSKPEGGPISQMELHFDDHEDEEQEQGSIPAKPRVPANGVVRSTTRPDCSEDAQWDAGAVMSRNRMILTSCLGSCLSSLTPPDADTINIEMCQTTAKWHSRTCFLFSLCFCRSCCKICT
ncbi:homologous recombination OB-fold protein-like isoform X2 [Ictalurus furcatus]|uniref:homologous recombination OB-fold protein-like isoform X2 n=1 Tax=Ictalurus furcatus TaxID=66913 RepID=UPI0023502C82|nr:homologous recombination OB-fold protein-like isoform X2 [Ictalurus furcatus]